ncbi:MAG: hypothetical protein WBJ16_00520 [Smithellaceae bacterium]
MRGLKVHAVLLFVSREFDIRPDSFIDVFTGYVIVESDRRNACELLDTRHYCFRNRTDVYSYNMPH